jgi:hypothetical protein
LDIFQFMKWDSKFLYKSTVALYNVGTFIICIFLKKLFVKIYKDVGQLKVRLKNGRLLFLAV